MDDLVAWLGAQLDADQQLAEDAIALPGADGQWSYVETRGGEHKVVDSLGYTVTGHYDADAQPYFCEPHIAAHDPARVLREIDAKRQVVAAHTKAVEAVEELTALRERLRFRGRDLLMTELEQGSAVHKRDTLHGVLRLLAEPYADRPGYQDSWRP